MDWGCSSFRTFVPQPPEPSFDFLYNYDYNQRPGMDMRHGAMAATPHMMIPGMEKNNSYGGSHQEKKKRLTSDQLESLEKSFQEEIKLDPERKMKLSKELGLQPRQIAVWFQNRRARWKAKHIEMLYDSLRHEYDAVSRENQNLQKEVLKLKSVLREQVTRKQASTGYTEISGEETVESTSTVAAIRSSNKQQAVPRGGGMTNHHHSVNNNIAEGNNNYIFSVEEYNNSAISSPFWGALPSNYP